MAILNIVGLDATTGQLRVAQIGDMVKAPPGVVTGGTPTIAVTAALGTGGSASIVGTNKAGKITVNSGTLALALGKILRFSFADGLSFPNGCACTFSAANDNFASVIGQLYVDGGVNYVDLYVRGTALGAAMTFIGNYEITGY